MMNRTWAAVLLATLTMSGTATALTRTSLLALSAQDLHALMKRDPRVAERIKDVVEKRTGNKVVAAKADDAKPRNS